MLDKKVILVTGGTGSFGKKFIETALTQYEPRKVICYSRDELKQFELQQAWPVHGKHPIRYFIGDVRDLPRLRRAMEGVDIVIHAAAFKQVPAAEYNPFEAVKTNILGSQNIIDAAMECGVTRVIALSTDKAVAPINLYGATKLAADKLFIAANNFSGSKDIRLAVVRYGNVMGSRGSVIPFFVQHREKGFLPVTDSRMTRFNITLKSAVDFVIQNLGRMRGREIFVPKIPSYRILDVAEAIAPDCRIEEIGSRQGDKLHEALITTNEACSTLEYDQHFVVMPFDYPLKRYKSWSRDHGFDGQVCAPKFSYSSDANPHFLTADEIRDLIQTHLGIQLQHEPVIEVADY